MYACRNFVHCTAGASLFKTLKNFKCETHWREPLPLILMLWPFYLSCIARDFNDCWVGPGQLHCAVRYCTRWKFNKTWWGGMPLWSYFLLETVEQANVINEWENWRWVDLIHWGIGATLRGSSYRTLNVQSTKLSISLA